MNSETMTQQQTEARWKASERRVMHVDDDPAILRLVAKALDSQGYEVISVSAADEALGVLAEQSVQMALLDIDMPKRDGLSLLQEIKQHDGSVQVLMLTGVVSMSSVLKSMRYGAEACVFKPLNDINELLIPLKAAFEKRDRWWNALHDLKLRKTEEQRLADNNC